MVDTDFRPASQAIALTVDGEERQRASRAQMIFKVPMLVAYLSRIMMPERGDLNATGTPAGVGPLVPGNVVEVTIEGLGTLTNRVAE